MNKEELKDYISRRLLKKYAKQYKSDPVWAWNKIREAVQGATVAEKKEIINALSNTSIVRNLMSTEADNEAETMMQDDSLDLNELTRVLEG